MNSALLEQLYLRFARELLLYLCSLSRDRALAEDLMQDTFLKALLALPDGHPNFRAWLYRVARNLYFTHYRRHSREVPHDEQPDAGPGPEEEYLQTEEKRRLYRALQELPETQREVMVLYYFSGLSHREIAQAMELRADHVRVLASRARQKMQRILNDDGQGDMP